MPDTTQDCCLEHMLGELAERIGPQLAAAGLEPVYELDPTVPPSTPGRAKELDRALSHLLLRAMALGWQGELQIGLRLVTPPGPPLTIECSMRPGGPGEAPGAEQDIRRRLHWPEGPAARTARGLAPVRQRVLLVDHRPAARGAVGAALRALECTVFQAEDAAEATGLLAAMTRVPDTLILNPRLGLDADLEPARRVLRCWGLRPVLLLAPPALAEQWPDARFKPWLRPLPPPVLPRRLAAALAAQGPVPATAGARMPPTVAHVLMADRSPVDRGAVPATGELAGVALRGAAGGLHVAAGTAQSGDTLAPVTGDLDRIGALARMGGNEALYHRLLAAFCSEEPATVAAIAAALDQGDPARAAALAHGLKGVAANLGINRVAATARDLEHAARHGHPVAQALGALRTAMTRITAPAQEPPAARHTANTHDAARLEPLLARLRQRLAEDDAEAIDDLEQLMEALKGDRRQQLLAPVARQVRRYDFPGALASLEQCCDRLAPTAARRDTGQRP